MKYTPLFGLALLASCASTESTSSGSEREDMERKLIGFQEKYDRFDYNGDGYLTPTEVTNGIKNEGIEGVSTEDVSTIFDYYDTNKDGRISLAEINAAQERGPDAALRARDGA